MRLTVCVIAKDEEIGLPIMLDSVKEVADEIVICDTGSSDRTKEIAATYTDKVYDIPWEDSFAKARNLALEKCTGDWILSIDCDEVVSPESAPLIKRAIETADECVDLILVSLVMCRDDGTPFQEFLAERLFKRRNDIRWEGDMHNWVNVAVDERRAVCTDIRLMHNRRVKTTVARAARCVQRQTMAEGYFLPKIVENPQDRRSMFYLAGTYFDSEKYDEAIEWWEKYLLVSDWPDERYQAAYMLAQIYAQRGDTEKAKQVLSAHLIDDWRRAEAYVMLGRLALADRAYWEAEWWFRAATMKPQPTSPMFVEQAAHTWEPHFYLWQTYIQIGDNQKAAFHGDIAIQNNCPYRPEIIKFNNNHWQYGDKRILCLVDRGQMDFIQPLIDSFRADGRTVEATSELPKNYADYEVIWCEWAGPLAIELTKLPKKTRIIVRVHGWEVNTDWLTQINWDIVDDVVFDSRELMRLAYLDAPLLSRTCNIHHVPPGADCGSFSIGEGKTGKKIAMLGYCNARKNIPLAIQILAACPKDYELHIAGDWQDGEVLRYLEHIGKELSLQGRLKLYGRIEDRNAWFADKDYILSTSVRETFHCAVAEGMAAGLKPVIHNWASANEVYEDEWLFNTVDEAVRQLTEPCNPEAYRAYAMEHLDIAKTVKRVNRILTRPTVSVVSESGGQFAYATHVLNSLERLGCRTDAMKPDVAILSGHSPQVEAKIKDSFKILYHGELVKGDSKKAIQSRELIADTVPQVDIVACGDPTWGPEYIAMGAKRFERVEGGGADWPWETLTDIPKRYDIGFYGALTPRREKLLKKLGKKFDIAVFNQPNQVETNRFVNMCKIMLNIHAYEDELFAEWRIGECMAAGACVVSEPLHAAHPYDPDCFIQTDDLAVTLKATLADRELQERIGKKAHSWVWRHHTLDGHVEKLLELVGL